MKNWGQLPSAEAESDTPGDEKPFIFAGAGAGGAAYDDAGGGSNTVLAEYSGDALGGIAEAGETDPLTKIRVNSPGAGAACDSNFGD